MKKEEIRELMKENFDEITQDVYARSWRVGESSHPCEDGNVYFKPKQNFPIVFDDGNRRVSVYSRGNILLEIPYLRTSITFNDSRQVLFDAVDKAKQLSKK